MTEARKVIAKRRFPRRRFRQKIGVLWRGSYAISESVQIGEGGMLAAASFGFEIGDNVIVSFQIPGREFVVVKASVQYERQENGRKVHGLKFLNISFEQRRLLRDFVSAKTEAEAHLEGVFVK